VPTELAEHLVFLALSEPMKPPALAVCDQEVNKRILAVPHKVREEVSDKEMWNHSEPRDVRVSLPRRADE